jgi:integrase/recombinase XerD
MDIQLDEFLSFCTVVNGGLDRLSLRNYKYQFIVFKEWLKIKDLSLSTTSIEQFFYERKKAGSKNSTLNGYYAFFRKLQKYCLKKDLDASFLEGIRKFKKIRPTIEPLSLKEIEKLLAAQLVYKYQGRDVSLYLNFVYTTFYVWLAQSGCRLTESIRLQVKHIDIENRQVNIPPEITKTDQGLMVVLFEPTLSLLKKIIKDKNPNDFVFTGIRGTPLLDRNVERDLQRRAEATGIAKHKRVYPHLFRHSLATALAGEGIDIAIIASILNHSNIQTTYGTYIHFASKPKREALTQQPLTRKHLPPKEKLRIFIEAIKKFNLSEDDDFSMRIIEGKNSFSLDVFIK